MTSAIPVNIEVCPRCGESHRFTVSAEDVESGLGQINYGCPNRKRLLRLTKFHFDFTRNSYEHTPDRREILAGRYGAFDIEQKEERWREASASNIWIFPDYREKMDEVVGSYVAGHFFCAITAACCLVERALNVLVIGLRDDFVVPDRYRKIVARDSHIQNWEACWKCLQKWSVLSGSQVDQCTKIHRIRNDVCHYNPEFDYLGSARSVIRLVNSLFDSLFGVLERKDIFNVCVVPGEIWVKEGAQNSAFVRKFVAPHCSAMSACSAFVDDCYVEFDNDCDELTEEEFIERRKAFSKEARPEDRPDVITSFAHEGKQWALRIL